MSSIEKKFLEQLKNNSWLYKKIVVGVSGGADSMALSALLYHSKAEIILCHCNFKLRGVESDKEEEMVKNWAAENNIPLRIKHFDVPRMLSEKGGNMEGLARQLRYGWFEEIRKEHNFDLIAVGHHSQDNIETLLINLFKGTGIVGLRGILPQRDRIIRPLLDFTKEELEAYNTANNIPWKVDSSNLGDAYLRNKIRHHLWPKIEEVFPDAEKIMPGNLKRFREVEMIYHDAIAGYKKRLIEKRGKDYYIPILKLKKYDFSATLLYEILKPFGFANDSLPELINLLDAPSGKSLKNKQSTVIKDRNFLIITENQPTESSFILINKPTEKEIIRVDDLTIEIRKEVKKEGEKFVPHKNNKKETLSLEDKDFPLVLRHPKEGDYFYPIGMNRKKKKVSKFLRDLKMPLHHKENVWILESNKRIVWVLGYRIDERFKVKPSDTEVMFFSLS